MLQTRDALKLQPYEDYDELNRTYAVPNNTPVRFDVRNDMLKLGFAETDLYLQEMDSLDFKDFYYIIHASFRNSFFDWLDQDTETIPTINNDDFFIADIPTFRTERMLDHICVNEDTWKVLIKHFGGGPEIKIPYEKSFDVKQRPFFIKVVKYPEIKKYKGLIIHPETKIEKVKKLICDEFNVASVKTKVMDFGRGTYHEDLDEKIDWEDRKINDTRKDIIVIEISNREYQHKHFKLDVMYTNLNFAWYFGANLFKYISITVLLDDRELAMLRKVLIFFKTEHLSLIKTQETIILSNNNHALISVDISAIMLRNQSKPASRDSTLYISLRNICSRYIIQQLLNVKLDLNGIDDLSQLKQIMSVLVKIRAHQVNFFIDGISANLKKFLMEIMGQPLRNKFEPSSELNFNITT